MIKEILKEITSRAVGCTEPAAVALAAATGSEAAGGKVRQIRVLMDQYTFKNALAVVLPNTGGEKGIELAAALGALQCQPERKLEIFQSISREHVELARDMVSQHKVQIDIVSDQLPIYIDALISTSKASGRAIIRGNHTNVVSVEVDGEHKKIRKPTGQVHHTVANLLLAMSIDQVLALTKQLDADDIMLLLEGDEMNMAIAREGIRCQAGLAVGAKLQELTQSDQMCRDVIDQAKMLTAAAVDARMAGCNMPVIANSGSGNQGLAVTIPISVMAKNLGKESSELARALALGHLFAGFARLHLGELSTICSSAIAGAIGASSGILYLLDKKGNLEMSITKAINNIVSNISGIFCPGANGTCALKLDIASAVAVETSLLTIRGLEVPARIGIIDSDAKGSLRNLAHVSQSMTMTQNCILDIMTKRAAY